LARGRRRKIPGFEPDQLRTPTEAIASELLSWRPEHGVISLYIDADPADRRERWRTEVKNGLRVAVDRVGSDADRETRLAVRDTAERLEQGLLDEPLAAEARGVIGFVEVQREEGEARWYGLDLSPRTTRVVHGPVAQLHLLLAMLDEAAPRGVAVISAERIRLVDWRLGRVEELHDWELEIFANDWRERKAEKPPDPARGQAISAAGKDQYGERLEHNRKRFAKQAGELAAAEIRRREWHELLVFGDPRYAREFEGAFEANHEPRHVDDADLISEPIVKLQVRLAELVPSLKRERERRLIERIKDEALAGARGAVGLQETLQALSEGRVEHLVYDAERDYPEPSLDDPIVKSTADGLPTLERMVELALSTSAAVTPVEGESAELLAEHEGVVALLRY
jgi:hypothetical protein